MIIRTQTLQLARRLSTPSVIRMSSTFPSDLKPRFSPGEDVSQVERGVESLMIKGWGLDEERMGVKKTYYFKSYFKAVGFVNLIAAESAAKKHHAVMTLKFGSVDIHWTTHNPRGLSQKDISMAEHCDRGAEVMGSVGAELGQKCR